MSGTKKIKNALISVYYKDNLEPVIHQLSAFFIFFVPLIIDVKFVLQKY